MKSFPLIPELLKVALLVLEVPELWSFSIIVYA